MCELAPRKCAVRNDRITRGGENWLFPVGASRPGLEEAGITPEAAPLAGIPILGSVWATSHGRLGRASCSPAHRARKTEQVNLTAAACSRLLFRPP
jgi:hypothetical protein